MLSLILNYKTEKMKVFYRLILFLNIIYVTKFQCYCLSNLDSYFRLEHENTAIEDTNNIKSFLDQYTSNQLECYMSCLASHPGKCCLIQMTQEVNAVKCSMYDNTLSDITSSVRSEQNSTIVSVVDCKKAKDCLTLYELGYHKDGVYNIRVGVKTVQVFCDMTKADGGWTVFQRRFDGKVPFNRTWVDYKNGFGDASGEYWLGNDIVHQMTKVNKNSTIRIEGMDHSGHRQHVTFNGFWIEDEASRYTLHLGHFQDGNSSLSGDALAQNGRPFVTSYQNLDDDRIYPLNFADTFGGGWWYSARVFDILANSYYSQSEDIQDTKEGIVWNSWKGQSNSLKSIQLQFK